MRTPLPGRNPRVAGRSLAPTAAGPAPTVLGMLPKVLAALVAVAACTPAAGTPGASVTSAPGATAEATTASCDTSNLPGWPKPGDVTTSGIIPVLASSERLVGRSRLLFALVDDQNRPIANQALQVHVGFYDLCADPAKPTQVLDPVFTWGIVGQRAFYVATPDFSRAGTWGAAIAVRDPATGTTSGAKLQFSVSDHGTTPRIGDPAPSAKSLTLADVGGDIRQVSSDPNPEPAFYQISIDAALAAKQPFLIAFATPAFCKSAQCGPTLDLVKAAVRQAPIRVVAVEPYQLTFTGGRLQPVLQDGGFVPVAAATAYGIPTEPWLFLVDARGKIAGSYEAVVGQQELVDAIRAVTPQGSAVLSAGSR